MGAWGTGILDNDDAMDVYSPYVGNFNNEYKPYLDGIEDLLYLDGKPALNDNAMGWLGLAQAKLETNTVDDEIIDMVGFILTDEIDFDLWEDDEEMLAEWTQNVENLYLSLKESTRK